MVTTDSNSPQKKAQREWLQKFKKTPYGAASLAWNALRSRAGNRYGSDRIYANVEVRMTRDEFIAWAVPEYARWFSERPDDRPSIDRIDPDGHYELGNIQLLELGENSRKSRGYDRTIPTPDGMRRCPDCDGFLPVEAFYRTKTTGALSTYCKRHFSAREKARYHERQGHVPPIDKTHGATQGVNKWCPDCELLLPLSEFYREKRQKDGLTKHCKVHHNQRLGRKTKCIRRLNYSSATRTPEMFGEEPDC